MHLKNQNINLMEQQSYNDFVLLSQANDHTSEIQTTSEADSTQKHVAETPSFKGSPDKANSNRQSSEFVNPDHLRHQLLRVSSIPILDRNGTLANKGPRGMTSTLTNNINVDLGNLRNLNLMNDPYQLDNQALQTQRLEAALAEKRNTAVAESSGEHLSIPQENHSPDPTLAAAGGVDSNKARTPNLEDYFTPTGNPREITERSDESSHLWRGASTSGLLTLPTLPENQRSGLIKQLHEFRTSRKEFVPLKPFKHEMFGEKQRGKTDSLRASKLNQLKAIHSQLRAEHNFTQASVYDAKFLAEERVLKISKSVEKKPKSSSTQNLLKSQRSQKDGMISLLRKQQDRYLAKEQSLTTNLFHSLTGPEMTTQSQDTAAFSKNQSHLQSKLLMPQSESLLMSQRSTKMESMNMRDIKNYDSMFEANDSLANLSLNQSISVPTKKDSELERAKIEKTLKILDRREISLWNAQEKVKQAIKESKGLQPDHNVTQTFFKEPIEYFSSIQHALFQVMLETKYESKSFYSKSLLKFIEQICQSMSLSNQYFQRNLELCFSAKDKKIHLQSQRIDDLEKEIEELKQKLISEDGILDEEKVGSMRLQAKEYLEKDTLIEDTDCMYNLLEKSTHSGVTNDLQAVLNLLKVKKNIEDEGDLGRPSQIDRETLGMSSFQFLKNLEDHMMEKAKVVQIGTSKRVIKQFHKNLQLQEQSAQTTFNDDQIIKDLQYESKLQHQSIGELQAQIKSEQMVVSSLRGNLDDAKKQNMAANSRCEKLERKSDELEDRLRAEKNQLYKLESKLTEFQKEKADLQERVIMEKQKQGDLDQRIIEMRQTITERDLAIRKKQQSLEEAEQAARHRESELEKHAQEMRQQLEEAQQQIRRKEEAVRNMFQENETLQRQKAEAKKAAEAAGERAARLQPAKSQVIEPQVANQLQDRKEQKKVELQKRPTMMDADIKAVSTQKLLAQAPIQQIKEDEVEESSKTSEISHRSKRSMGSFGSANAERIYNRDEGTLEPRAQARVSPGARQKGDSSHPSKTIQNNDSSAPSRARKNEDSTMPPPAKHPLNLTGSVRTIETESAGVTSKDINNNLIEMQRDTQESWIGSVQRKNDVSKQTRHGKEQVTPKQDNKDLNIRDYEDKPRPIQASVNKKHSMPPSLKYKKPLVEIRAPVLSNQGRQINTLNQTDLESSADDSAARVLPEQRLDPDDRPETNSHLNKKLGASFDSSTAELEEPEEVRKLQEKLNAPIDLKAYKHVLDVPQRDLAHSSSRVKQLLQKRISKIDYIDTVLQPTLLPSNRAPQSISFHQQTQTTIDTSTFLELLNKQQKDLKETATQCERYQGDLSYLYKQYGKHIFDFGQSVDEGKINHTQQLIAQHEKNRMIFDQASPRKTPDRSMVTTKTFAIHRNINQDIQHNLSTQEYKIQAADKYSIEPLTQQQSAGGLGISKNEVISRIQQSQGSSMVSLKSRDASSQGGQDFMRSRISHNELDSKEMRSGYKEQYLQINQS